MVAERVEARNPITYSELLSCLQSEHSIVINFDGVRGRIRGFGTGKHVIGVSTENDRINEWYDERGRTSGNLQSGVGRAEGEEVTVLVPDTFQGGWVPVPRQRSTRRAQ
jgi:hypothetical protein